MPWYHTFKWWGQSEMRQKSTREKKNDKILANSSKYLPDCIWMHHHHSCQKKNSCIWVNQDGVNLWPVCVLALHAQVYLWPARNMRHLLQLATCPEKALPTFANTKLTSALDLVFIVDQTRVLKQWIQLELASSWPPPPRQQLYSKMD